MGVFGRFLSCWVQPTRKSKSSRPKSKPYLEALEDRTAPAQITWTGAAGGGDYNWSNPDNWNGGLPTNTDTVLFTNNNVRSVLDNNFPETSIAGIQIDSTYTAAFEVAKNNFSVNGTFTCNGTSTFTIDANKTFILNGAVSIAGHRITNQGTTTWGSNGNFFINGMGGEFWNTTGATFNDNGTGLITGDAMFTNAGTFNKQTNGGEAIIGSTFNSTGTVNVNTGQLTFKGAATFFQGSTLTIAANREVNFVAGIDRLSGNIGGDPSGTVSLETNTDGSTPTVTVGSINLSTNLSITAGTFNVAGTVYTNQQNSTLTWTGGTIQGSGTIYVTANEVLNIQGTGTKVLNQTTIFNYGNAAWSGTGNIQVSNGARIVIDGNYAPSGSFDIQNDQTVQNMGGADSYFILQNGGSLTKSAGTGLSDIQMFFQNNGGTINLMGRRVQTRQLLQNTGALQLNGGELDVAGNFTENGGTIQVDTGTLSVTGSAMESAGQLGLAGGMLIPSSGMQISSGAVLSGSGKIGGNVTNAGQIAVGAAGGGTMGTLIISGNYTQQSGGYLLLDVSGASSADHLSITGLATLNGILSINGTPSGPGASFDLLDWGSRSGTFSYISLPSLSSGTWYYQYDVPPGHFTLEVI